ncbi:MAG TPA: hypothetical protein VK936_11755, partial [Longimicrobiales bacterium]|nr:hypothetical protein [Longimicrobiales bacterium]
MHPHLMDAMVRQPAFAGTLDRLPGPAGTLRIDNLPGSAPSLLVATLARQIPNRVWVVIAPSAPDAETVDADIQAVLGSDVVALYPQRETLPYEAAEHHFEVSGLRVETLEGFLAGRARIVVTTARALQELADIPAGLADLRLTVAKGDRIRLADLAARLDGMGFERTGLVEAVGEYAVRGGILDLFGFGAPEPVRIEMWEDDILSIRQFDILDQRSTGELERVDILPVDLAAHGDAATRDGPAGPRRSLLDLLTRDAIIVEMEPGAAQTEFARTWDQVLHLHDAERKRGGDPEPPERLFLEPETAAARVASFGRIVVDEP